MNLVRRKTIQILIALALVLCLGIVAVPMAGTVEAGGTTWYVDDDNCPGPGSGTLADPFCSIQDALIAASYGDTIDVAAGTYNETITLEDGVQVLGAGAHVTTIDGRGSGPVVYGNNVGSTTKLDGFTITNGSTAEGGGILLSNSSLTISNCIFSGNSAEVGGGMYNSESLPTVTDSSFSGNSADYGGGMYNSESSPTLTDCNFSGNSADFGGGMCNSESSPMLTDCVFSGNSANSGGGMFNSDSSPTLTDCIFSGNSADYGGGMYNYWYTWPTLTNCNFSGNSATIYGGGMYNFMCSPTVNNCIFSGNSADYGGGMYNYESSRTVTNCNFSGNSAKAGGGMYNSNSSPTVTNCNFSGNSADYGGGMSNRNSSPTVTNCIFSGNSATDIYFGGGGMYNFRNSSPTVTNCIFSGNSATSNGGGMCNHEYCSPTVTNCIFSTNTASVGGGIWADGTSSPTIDYNDVWNNPGGNYGGSCSPGPHDISQDPLFVNPATQDFHSKQGSPCIDAGTNLGAPTEDIEGNPRPMDGDGDGWAITDMGAYEFVPPRPPAYFRYLHSHGLFNLTDPVDTQWHELWPIFCREYHLSSWEDNGDGILSYCDTINMYEKPDGEFRDYHVENVTITLFVTPDEIGDPMYIELEGGYNASALMNPLNTQWHEIYPVFCREYHLLNWIDSGDPSGELSFCDCIVMENKVTGELNAWHVEEVAVDIIVTPEPPPVGGEAYPVTKASLLVPWIAVGVVLASGTSWYILKRRRARS